MIRKLWTFFKSLFGFGGPSLAVEPAQPPPPPVFDRQLVGPEYGVGTKCIQCGEYVSVCDGQPVLKPNGEFDVLELDVGDRFPPGLARGYRWRKILEPNLPGGGLLE